MLMDQVDTLYVGRYWSEVLCCTMITDLGDLEVKVKELEICVKVLVKVFISIYLLNTSIDGSS